VTMCIGGKRCVTLLMVEHKKTRGDTTMTNGKKSKY